MLRSALLAVLLVLAAAAPASGAVLHGVTGGGTDVGRWTADVAAPQVQGHWVTWGQDVRRLLAASRANGARPVLHVSTTMGQGAPERLSPLAIARGEGDDWLRRVNAAIAASGRTTYVRLLAEMNHHNSTYAAFGRTGRPRGRSRSTATFRQMWRRVALVLRGGSAARIDARLRRLRLPPLGGDDLPPAPVALQWVPLTRGSPDIPANMPRAYWPGAAYVDWVGTDFYSKFPNFRALDAFYREFRSRPFVFGEWAVWGRDDPAFVRRFLSWVRRHPRVRMAVYNDGTYATSPFRLDRHPRSMRALRRALRGR